MKAYPRKNRRSSRTSWVMDIQRYLQEKRELVERALDQYFMSPVLKRGEEGYFNALLEAIHYSLLNGGKRIRPILCIASFEAAGGKGDGILPFACALEMIHTYSLIHDDLPAIDNDDYRRGRLTCHKVFGEAIGILTGDALLTEAFKLMTNQSDHEAKVVLEVVNEVAQAAGIFGMIGGQVLDVESEGKSIDPSTLQAIHRNKTGALIRVSVRTGVKLAGASHEVLQAFTTYGEKIGLAFQIVDDILNVEGDRGRLGKNIGSDQIRKKATYPSILGMEVSKRMARELTESAIESLSPFGPEVEPLRAIARFIVSRQY